MKIRGFSKECRCAHNQLKRMTVASRGERFPAHLLVETSDRWRCGAAGFLDAERRHQWQRPSSGFRGWVSPDRDARRTRPFETEPVLTWGSPRADQSQETGPPGLNLTQRGDQIAFSTCSSYQPEHTAHFVRSSVLVEFCLPVGRRYHAGKRCTSNNFKTILAELNISRTFRFSCAICDRISPRPFVKTHNRISPLDLRNIIHVSNYRWARIRIPRHRNPYLRSCFKEWRDGAFQVRPFVQVSTNSRSTDLPSRPIFLYVFVRKSLEQVVDGNLVEPTLETQYCP